MNTDEIESLIRRYAEGPASLRAAWARVPEEARKWRPGPGKWSAHEVVVHRGDSEANTHGWLSSYGEHLEIHAQQIDRYVAAFRART